MLKKSKKLKALQALYEKTQKQRLKIDATIQRKTTRLFKKERMLESQIKTEAQSCFQKQIKAHQGYKGNINSFSSGWVYILSADYSPKILCLVVTYLDSKKSSFSKVVLDERIMEAADLRNMRPTKSPMMEVKTGINRIVDAAGGND